MATGQGKVESELERRLRLQRQNSENDGYTTLRGRKPSNSRIKLGKRKKKKEKSHFEVVMILNHLI